MKSYFTILFAVLLLIAQHSSATIPTMEQVGHGQGRYLGMIKVYDATLLVDPNDRNLPILHADASRCLELRYHVSLTSGDFIAAADTILKKQQPKETLAQVQRELDTLHRHYRDVKPGDSYSLCYQAAQRKTSLSLNGTELVSVISAEFAEVYFGIWLNAANPIDAALQRQLLSTNR